MQKGDSEMTNEKFDEIFSEDKINGYDLPELAAKYRDLCDHVNADNPTNHSVGDTMVVFFDRFEEFGVKLLPAFGGISEQGKIIIKNYLKIKRENED